jgi:protein arginine N-methyltransferase 1
MKQTLRILFAMTDFHNALNTGEIPSFDGDEKVKATNFANYFCTYAKLYHQKQMLNDHNCMAAYHSVVMG